MTSKQFLAAVVKTTVFRRAGWCVVVLLVAVFLTATLPSCGVYSFNEKGTIPDSVKTVRVNFFDNKAPIVNPQISPLLTDQVRQKIIRQTRLINTNNETAHYDISGTITDYSISTTGVGASTTTGRSQASLNRLTVRVHIKLNKQQSGDVVEYDVSRSFDFDANQNLQTAEAANLPELIRNLSDEIFNRIFSDW